MSIQFRCNACGREYDLPELAAGKKAKCECGVLLVVPADTDQADTFDPAAPSEIGARPATRPPRTLAAAARQAAAHQAATPQPIVREPPAPDRPLAPAEPKGPQPVAAPDAAPAVPSLEIPPPLPPLPPSSHESLGQPTPPNRPLEKRYRNLRAYCGWLRLVSWLVLAATGLILVGGLAVTIPRIMGTTLNPLTIARLLIPSLVTAATGAGLFVFINATAELFHVLMDIEENTRQR